MEEILKKEKYSRFLPVWHDALSGEFTADCVIPDTMPDIRDLLDSEGTLLLRGKATEDGCVVLTASISATVLYAPDGEEDIRSLSVTIPVEMRMNSTQIEESCRTVCQMRIRSLDGKMINSRKIAVRADVSSEVWCYRDNVLEIPSGMKQNETSVHILKNTESVVHVSDVREKSFVITDQYSLPNGLEQVSDILSQRVEVCTEDVKFVSGKVVFRGQVSVCLLLAGEGSDRIVSARYETSFSQIMEADVIGEDAIPDVSLQLTGVYFDPPGREDVSGKIGVEIHMVAQCVCRRNQEVAYIDDLYSNREELLPKRESLRCVSAVQPVSMRQTVTGRAEGAAGEGRVLSAAASILGVTTEGETVKTAVNVRLISLQSSGQCVPIRCRLNAEFTTELSADTELQNVMVRVADVYYSAAGGDVDLRVVLQMDAHRVSQKALTYVEAVAVGESDAAKKDIASITLVRRAASEDIWQLAKRYRSSPEAILSANEGNSSGLLLIPKSR